MKMKARQDGFSLVEIMIATMILTFGLLAMAAGTGYIAAQLRSSSFDTQRTQAKQRMIEQLRGTRYAQVTDNPSTPVTSGRYTFTWRVVDSANQLTKRLTLITTGPAYRQGRGARSTVVDTMYVDLLMP